MSIHISVTDLKVFKQVEEEAFPQGNFIKNYLRGPLKILAGKVMIALNKSKTAFTVMPISRKGRRRSQTIGYKNRAKSAMGQQIINRMNQSKNLINA